MILKNNPGTKTIRVYDCPGFVSNTPRDCVFEENMKKVIDGNVMKDYQVVHFFINIVFAIDIFLFFILMRTNS